uniref:Uncharacterized protein n=1 Tax=Anguilla anguilla TaxID=7936 RepID=A0A0E9SDI6_ANGAN
MRQNLQNIRLYSQPVITKPRPFCRKLCRHLSYILFIQLFQT